MATAHLVQFFLPLRDNAGAAFPKSEFTRVRAELTDRFGGVTAYARAPAQGIWRDGGQTKRDDLMVLEVMADRLDDHWWAGYRATLEEQFRQAEIVIRAQEMRRL